MISAEMSKKEYILAILRAIENDWSLAKDIQRFVLQGKFDDAALDNLAEIMNTTVHQYISASGREKLSHAIEAVNKIKQLEQQDMLTDESEIANLESMIQHL